MPAIRNIGGAVTRLTRICTERKAGYTGGRYAGNEEMARRKLRAQMQASRAGIRAIAAAAAAASLSSLSFSRSPSLPEIYRTDILSYVPIFFVEYPV